MIENPLKELRILKGAPLSIIFALMMARQTVNIKWLKTVTGYSDKTVTEAIDLLIEFDYIKRISGQKIQLTKTKQLPLMIEETKEEKLFLEEKNEEINEKLLIELEEYGIGEPVRSELAKKDYEYIHAHLLNAKEKSINQGLLIYKIRQGDPAPKLNKNNHLENCNCLECEKIKYPNINY